MAPFDRSYTISYSSAIASGIALFCALFEIFHVEEYRYLDL